MHLGSPDVACQKGPHGFAGLLHRGLQRKVTGIEKLHSRIETSLLKAIPSWTF